MVLGYLLELLEDLVDPGLPSLQEGPDTEANNTLVVEGSFKKIISRQHEHPISDADVVVN